MLRGRILFEQLNYDSCKTTTPVSKGRSKMLLNSRNRCLFYRYWYYSKRHKVRYDQVLKLLSNEFHLSERTIIDALSKNQLYMKELYKENPQISKLKIEFGHLIWK